MKHATVIASLLLLAACKHDLESTPPALLELAPSLVCNDQLTTTVAVSGAGLSPTVVDGVTDGPSLLLPQLWLERGWELDGSPGDDAVVELPDDQDGGIVRWLGQSSMEFDFNPELAADPGLYDFWAHNVDENVGELPRAIAVVPPPVLDDPVPLLVCNQHDQVLRLTGSGFLEVEGTLPVLTTGEVPLPIEAMDDCFGLGGPTTAASCTEALTTLPARALEPGVWDVVLTNPAPAECVSTEPVVFEIVSEPVLADVDPDLVCVEQEDRLLTLTGEDFLVTAEGALPSIAVGAWSALADAASGCEDLTGPAGGQLCTELTLTVPAGAVPPGVAAVVVTDPDPASCFSTDEVYVEVVPAPTLASVVPDPVCDAQGDNTWTLSGTGFVVTATGDLPTITVGTWSALADAASDCTDLLGPAGGRSCATLTLTLPQGTLGEGVYDVQVANPDPAGCVSVEAVAVEILPPPVLSSVEADLVCDDQGDTSLILTGEDFAVLDGATPSVTIGTWTGTADSADGCVDLAGPSGGQSCTQLSLTLPAASLDAGVYDLVVTNPYPAACVSSEAVQLEVVDAPTLSAVVEELVCTDESDQGFALSGTGFLVLADGTLPTVVLGSWSGAADSATGCTDLTGPSGGSVCTDLAFTLPVGGEGVGVHDLTVLNPEPAACTGEGLQVEVVDTPSVASISPELACDAQGDTTLSLSGAELIVLADGTSPTLTVGTWSGSPDEVTGCTDLTGPAGGERCTDLSLTLPEDALGAGVFSVSLTNPSPADCTSDEAVEIEIIGAPELTALAEELSCDEQGDTEVLIAGTGFAVLADGTHPTVTVGSYSAEADTASDCTPLTGPAGGQSCAELTLTLPQGEVGPEVHEIAVTNPWPADCETEAPLELEVVAPPVLTSVVEQLACDDQGDVDLSLGGEGFVVLADGSLPTVTVGGWSGAATSASGCTSLVGPGGGESCTGLDLSLPAGWLGEGVWEITVTNPAPADCIADETGQIEIVPPPTVVLVDPESTCDGDGDEAVTLSGEAFLVLADGTWPTVEIGGEPMTLDDVSDCAALAGPDGGQLCTTVELTYPDGTLGDGSWQVVVTNPAPASCVSTDDAYFSVTLPPTITSVDPTETCSTGSTIQVYGTSLTTATEVYFDTEPAVSVTWVSDTQLSVEVPGGLTDESFYDVTVLNPDCGSDTLVDGLWVEGVPVVFYVDPPVVYNGVNFQATVYFTGVEGLSDVSISNPTTGYSDSLDFSYEGLDPTQLSALIPSGLTEGDYDLTLTSDIGCDATLEDAFYAEDDLTVTVGQVDPPMGWTDEETAVVITGSDFQDVPRLYLNPDSATSTTTATLLRSVRYRDDTELLAVIPSGLDVDSYDLVVINPDGSIGLLEDAFEVVTDAPPDVTSVAPASVTTSDGDITIYGEDFRSPSVQLTCVSPGSTTETTVSATVTSDTSTEIEATFSSGSFSNGDVCVVTVTNSDDTYDVYSAISITSPSYNLYGFSATSTMTTARRATAVFPGMLTDAERYLYAIGGDDGTASGALDSVERVDVDQYGELGSWAECTECALPSPRTLAGWAVIDDFVYVVGGHDGTDATDEVLRAQVLDPLEAPRFDALAMSFGDGSSGLVYGTYIYRIAALYPDTWEANPDGESLASDPIVVYVPDVPDLIEVNLDWIEVEGADGYRIYRSPVADAASGDEEWIADVSGGSITEYTDAGDTADDSLVPLEEGTLGQWFTAASLSTARQSPGVGWGYDPSDSGTAYIYAAGGLDDTGTVLSSIEYLEVTVVSDQQQDTATSWTTSANSLTDARYELGAWSATSALNPIIPDGETWVYFGGGATSGSIADTVDVGEVTAGGELGSWTTVDDMGKNRSGYATAIASSQLYAFGGHNSGTEPSGDSAEITGPPTLDNWNALGLSMVRDRYLTSATQESAHIYIIGGETDTEAATADVEYGPW